ncbi:hypothetical protein [Roseovarius bejariae]|nr:hypothetical protein [Roseovarius bejariae]
MCKTPTIGPSDEGPHAVTNIGIAAHITAAAPGRGARRYDPSLTPEQRSGIENAIWLCRICDGIVDRDEVRFPAHTLKHIRRNHTEFVRLGTQVETAVGLIAIGPAIVAGGQVVRSDASCLVVRLTFFLEGSADDLLAFVNRFEAHPHLSRYVLLSELGLGGLLDSAPGVEREGAAWQMTFRWQPEAPRLAATDLAGMCRQTGELISGAEYWVQCFEMALEQPPGTWFADMDGGSHLSELYDTLRGSTWFEALVTCELIRLACIPAPPKLGDRTESHPPIPFVRRVRGVSVPKTELNDGRLTIEVDADLEGYGRWTGPLSLFIYTPEALGIQRAKAQWMTENKRRIENGERALPGLVPPADWKPDDGFPE